MKSGITDQHTRCHLQRSIAKYFSKLYWALSNMSISLPRNLSVGGYITITGWNISCFIIWKWVIEAMLQANGQLGRFVYAAGVNVAV